MSVARAAGYRFGPVAITGARGEFYRLLNDSVLRLIRGLPRTVQSEAMLLYMAYNGLALGDRLDFFRNFYVPSWSMIPWVAEAGGGLSPETMSLCAEIHAMAMLLHSLDDHLNDGELPASHLTVLIRSEAWRRFAESQEALTTAAKEMAHSLIDEYYGAVTLRRGPVDLEEYCRLFRSQMATGSIAPLAAAAGTGRDQKFFRDLRRAQEHFGVAWRLLDDLQDTEEDFMKGEITAVYCLLDDAGRVLWLKPSGEKDVAALTSFLHEEKLAGTLVRTIIGELERAAALAEGIGLSGLADEYRALAVPLVGSIQDHGRDS
ncbi:MAG: class 1 isoprenoid biosynthesis enzyme [Spirochaetes bacterium]|nr:class 1 isoprenoid biosynthesis enzyme [Spirochaetota bacterium]